MSSNEAGTRLPNGWSVPPQLADANLTENLTVGTFNTAHYWKPFGDDGNGWDGQTINVCIHDPTFGVMVLGYMTLGGKPDGDDPIWGAGAPASVAEDLTPADHGLISGTKPTPGPDHVYSPEMRAFADELRRLEPSFTEEDIAERVKYRFTDGKDQQADFRQARQWQQDFVAQRDTILSIMNDAEHAKSVAEMLSDRHLALGAASFAPSIWGAGASFADGALYLHEGNYWDAGLSFLAGGFGIISDAGLIKAALKGAEKAVELGKAAEAASKGNHAAQIAAAAAKVEKPAAAEIAKTSQTSDKIFLSMESFKSLPKSGLIDANLIRFSQDSAAATFKPPFGSIDEFATALASKSLDAASIAPIRIVEKNGLVFTLDNRRLYAFQRAGIQVPYQKLEAIPKRELFKFTTKNDGISIFIRGESQ